MFANLLVGEVVGHEPDLDVADRGPGEEVVVGHVGGEGGDVVARRVDALERALQAAGRVVRPALHLAVLQSHHERR